MRVALLIEKFAAKGGLDEGGTRQGCGSTVQFFVYTANPGVVASAAAPGQPKPADNSAARQPENAGAGLEVHEALQVELFAAEPLLMNPSNIDIDHKGRIWVAEIVNYRGHKGKRPEGDRIIILEDKNGDGKIEKETDGEGKVFYQDKDFNSPHGVTVFATPDGKLTKVIVAIGDKVEVRPMMYLALSYDHRIIDGREAVTFLVRVKECIEDPQRILLDM